MQLIRGLPLPDPPHGPGPVLALGNFDGLHPGHAQLLRVVRAEARALGAPPAVMTFEPHPRRFFCPDKGPLQLLPLHHKLRLLRDAGIERVYLMRFNRAFSEISAQDFIDNLLIRRLNVTHVVTGHDFVFGHKRQGNTAMLHEASEQGKIGYTQVQAMQESASPFSSSRIRKALSEGDMETVAKLLGRPYSLIGRVIHGEARGRTLGFPTANIAPLPSLLLPPNGVYAVTFSDGKNQHQAVANLGYRPTVGGNRLLLEVHGLHFSGNLYGKRLDVHFHHFIRHEQPFDSLEALQNQIQKDCETALNSLTE